MFLIKNWKSRTAPLLIKAAVYWPLCLFARDLQVIHSWYVKFVLRVASHKRFWFKLECKKKRIVMEAHDCLANILCGLPAWLMWCGQLFCPPLFSFIWIGMTFWRHLPTQVINHDFDHWGPQGWCLRFSVKCLNNVGCVVMKCSVHIHTPLKMVNTCLISTCCHCEHVNDIYTSMLPFGSDQCCSHSMVVDT